MNSGVRWRHDERNSPLAFCAVFDACTVVRLHLCQCM